MSILTKVSEAFALADIDITTKARVLLEALPYIQKFKGTIFVLKYGGSFMDDPNPELRLRVATDIVFLASVGIHVVVVHGGGKAISRAMEGAGVEPEFIQGLRVTTSETVEIVEKVLNDEVNRDICQMMADKSGSPFSLKGQDVLRCEPLLQRVDGKPVSLGRVGSIHEVDTAPIHQALQSGKTPILSPLALDAQGNLYNTNADEAAAKVAIALNARRLVYLCDVPGLMLDPKKESSLISTLPVNDVDVLKREGIIASGMLPKVDSGVEALNRGVHRVHLVAGKLPHSILLEIFTDKGVGTEIVHGQPG